jgi:hypothetical protein
MEAGKTVSAFKWRLVLLAVPFWLAGCQSPDAYYWGHYEGLVYAMYETPDKVPPERQAEIMEADLQKASADNKPVPPGFHAHLGYVYFSLGKLDLAQQEFVKEKTQFPESTVFMDRMLANLTKK